MLYRLQCLFFAAAFGFSGLTASAWAQTDSAPPPPNCKLLQLAAIDLTPVPDDPRLLVPVTLNGTPQKLLLGTAGGLITLNRTALDALHLPTFQSDVRILDADGYASRRYVLVKDFGIANVHVPRRTFAVTPDPGAGTNPVDDGAFDAGLRYHLDVEMDFAGRKLNYFSPDHCEGRVIYWPASDIGVAPITMHPRTDDTTRHGEIAANAGALGSVEQDNMSYLMSLMESGPGLAGSDIQIKVMLDGKEFTANIDTSLKYSTLNSLAARSYFDVTADSPGSAPAASLDSPSAAAQGVSESVTVYGVRSFAHIFHTLTFGGVTVTNPHFIVRPDQTGKYDPDNRYLTSSHIYKLDSNVEPDVSIGMDVLSKLRLYFAFREHRLFITPATPPAASTGAG